MSACYLGVRAFVETGLVHDTFRTAMVGGLAASSVLVLTVNGGESRMDQGCLVVRLGWQVEMLQACFALLVALVVTSSGNEGGGALRSCSPGWRH